VHGASADHHALLGDDDAGVEPVVVVASDAQIRNALRAHLRAVWAEASTCAEAIRLVQSVPRGIVVAVDESPRSCALELLEGLGRSGLRPPTVVVTRGATRRRRLLAAGAHEVVERLEDLPAALDDAVARAAAREGPGLRRILDDLFTFVGLVAIDGTLLDANRAALEVGGLTLAGERGKKLWDTYWFSWSPEVVTCVRDACDRAAAGELVRFDLVARVAGDARLVIDFQLAPLRDPSGAITHLVPSATDITARKAAEAALARSEAKLGAIIEQLPIGVGVCDATGRTTMLNPEGLRLHGFRSLREMLERLEQYRDEFVLRALDGTELPVDQWPISRALRGEEIRDVRVRLGRRDAERHETVSYDVVRVPDPDGAPLYVFLIQDIGARLRAEGLLRASEERYRTLFATIDEGFCLIQILWDDAGRPRDYRFVEVNPAFARQTGLVDAVGKTARELVPDLDASWFELYGGVAKTGQPRRFVNHAPAMHRWFDVYASRVGDPSESKVALVFGDISERRAVEDALVESEARFRALADNISQFAWMADPSGEITWYNRRWLDYTGTTVEEMLRVGWPTFHHEDHLDRVVRTFGEAVARGEPWEDTFPLRSKTGEWRWFLSRAQPIRNEQGEVVRWFGTNTDVTAQREVEELLRSAVRQRDEFLSLASHELRTPLTALTLQLQSARRKLGASADPAVTKKLDVAIRQGGRLGALIEELLDVSRIVSGRLRLHLDRFDLHELVRETTERLADFAARAGCAIEFRSEGAVFGHWDRARIEQVLVNLLTNAVKYGAGLPIEVELHADHDAAEVRIRDRGIGIDADDQARIFDRFEQAVSPKHYGGLGLGLYITREIVHAHGGTVTVESSPGEGAVFRVRLPRETEGPIA
jgi:PAS domain S-box-containing protein